MTCPSPLCMRRGTFGLFLGLIFFPPGSSPCRFVHVSLHPMLGQDRAHLPHPVTHSPFLRELTYQPPRGSAWEPFPKPRPRPALLEKQDFGLTVKNTLPWGSWGSGKGDGCELAPRGPRADMIVLPEHGDRHCGQHQRSRDQRTRLAEGGHLRALELGLEVPVRPASPWPAGPPGAPALLLQHSRAEQVNTGTLP